MTVQLWPAHVTPSTAIWPGKLQHGMPSPSLVNQLDIFFAQGKYGWLMWSYCTVKPLIQPSLVSS